MTLKHTAKQLARTMAQATVRRRAPFEPAQWALDIGPDGDLCCDGVSLAAVAETWGTPLHVLRASRLRDRAAGFLSGAARAFFSVKTNPTTGLLRVLFDGGMGGEVVSRVEYHLIRRLGLPADRIIVNGAPRDPAWLDEAIADDVALINLNGTEDLAPLLARARALGRRPRVGVRVAAGGWSGHFGEPESRAVPLIEEVARSSELEWTALHFHNGPLLRGAAAVDRFLEQALAFCDRLRAATGLSPSILDLGGSLACPTVDWLSSKDLDQNLSLALPLPPPDAELALSPQAFVAHCEAQVRRHFERQSLPVPQIWFEPGRALVADTQLTLTRVRTLRDVDDRHVAGLDAGVNILAPVPREYHEFFSVHQARAARDTATMLVGPLFHPGDVLVQRTWLPRLGRGDVVAVMDTGAYCQASSTQFSFLRPAVVMIDGGRSTLLRAAETIEDLVACDLRAMQATAPSA